MTGLVIDLFAGGGGASTGLEAALGRPVDVAINHSPVALAVHALNHPQTKHLTSDIWEVKPKEVTRGKRVAVLWASPDCTHFSVAKGDVPRDRGIRSLAWVVVEWAREVRPDCIFIENVGEFRTWGPLGPDGKPDKARVGETFGQWLGALEILGYRVDWRVLDASAFGAPTRRRRLFIVARCDGRDITWPQPTHGAGLQPLRTAAECIDWSIPCPSIFERAKPLAAKTQWRIAQGIRRFVIESNSPFIAPVGGRTAAPTLVQTGYGERVGQSARVLDLHQPLGTVVAGGAKHALISAFLAKHYGGVVGQELARPLGTVTAVDHHSLVTATLSGHPDRRGQVRAFLTTYYGSGDAGQALDEPLRTVVTHDRFGLVSIAGVDHVITDIGMRMLDPTELLRAQFGRFAATYDLSAAPTKTAKVRLIGNSVAPEVAEALVLANIGESHRRAA